MESKALKLITAAAVCTAIAVLFIFPVAARQGIINGLDLCAKIVIPSLFPFMVLAGFTAESGAANTISKPLSLIFSSLFRIPECASCAVLLSFISGYPVGAAGIAKLYNSGIIDRRTAERMLAFCVNAGPAMIIIAVGGGMLGDTIAGWILYVSHIAASVIIGAVWARFAKRCEEPPHRPTAAPSLADAFVNATSSACVSMLTICGYVTLFSSIIELTNTFAPWFAVFAEVTCGAKLAADSGLSVPLISAILGFGGISVMCQVSAMSEGLIRMPVLLFTRCMHAGLSYLICGGLLRLFNRPMEVISNLGSAAADFSIITVPLSLSMLIMATTFLFAIQHKS